MKILINNCKKNFILLSLFNLMVQCSPQETQPLGSQDAHAAANQTNNAPSQENLPHLQLNVENSNISQQDTLAIQLHIDNQSNENDLAVNVPALHVTINTNDNVSVQQNTGPQAPKYPCDAYQKENMVAYKAKESGYSQEINGFISNKTSFDTKQPQHRLALYWAKKQKDQEHRKKASALALQLSEPEFKEFRAWGCAECLICHERGKIACLGAFSCKKCSMMACCTCFDNWNQSRENQDITCPQCSCLWIKKYRPQVSTQTYPRVNFFDHALHNTQIHTLDLNAHLITESNTQTHINNPNANQQQPLTYSEFSAFLANNQAQVHSIFQNLGSLYDGTYHPELPELSSNTQEEPTEDASDNN